MRKENYVDGLLYELRNPECDSNGKIVLSEIYVQARTWNPYSDSSEKMMNRICNHLDADLVPDYCPLDEHIGMDGEKRRFVRELLFRVENQKHQEYLTSR